MNYWKNLQKRILVTKWSSEAKQELNELLLYISEKSSVDQAEKFRDIILATIDHIEYFPDIGRIVPEAKKKHFMEFLLKKYRLVYEYHGGEILEIVSVWNGAIPFPKNRLK